jgi:hypothetical protein
MDIIAHVKPDSYLVIELQDEVEYLLDDASIQAVRAGKETIPLTRLIDREMRMVSRVDIEEALAKKGPIDYLKGV